MTLEKFLKICEKGTPQQINEAIEAGADVNLKGKDENGFEETSALEAAVWANNLEAAAALLKGGAALETRTMRGQTPLMLAAYHGGGEIITALLEAGAAVNAIDKYDGENSFEGDTALIIAAGEGNLEAAAALIKGGADVDARNIMGQTALMFAAWNNAPEIIAALLAAGADAALKDNEGRAAEELDIVQRQLRRVGALRKEINHAHST